MSGAYTQGLSYNSSVLSRQKTFLSLFPNRSRSILRPARCQEWTTLSRHHQLSDEEILGAVTATTDAIWGCRSAAQTRFANLDIDTGSLYHNELSLLRLRQVLASVGLKKTKLYRSSNSGGWHLYCFFNGWEDSIQVQQSLSAWLISQSFLVGLGQLEVFPQPVTPKSLGHGLRLPLQRGFAWLSDTADLEVRREDMTADDAVSRFVQDMLDSPNDWSRAQALIQANLDKQANSKQVSEIEDKGEDGFSDLFTRSGLIPEVYQKGEKYWFEGLSAPGQRHEAVLSVGHYLWYRPDAHLPGARNAERREEAIKQWLETKHNGFSQTLNLGRWRPIEEDTKRACHWENKAPRVIVHEPYKLTERLVERLVAAPALTPERCQKANDRREQEARDKIRQALAVLLEDGRRPTVRGLARLSGCHRDTVKKHANIWSISRLSHGTGEYSSIGAGRPPALVVLASEKEVLHPDFPVGDSGDHLVEEPFFENESRELSGCPTKETNPSWVSPVGFFPFEGLAFPNLLDFDQLVPEVNLQPSLPASILENCGEDLSAGAFEPVKILSKERSHIVPLLRCTILFFMLRVCFKIILRLESGISPFSILMRSAKAWILPGVVAQSASDRYDPLWFMGELVTEFEFDALRRVLGHRADGLSDANLRRAMNQSVYKSDEWCFYCLLLAQRLFSRGDVSASENLLRKVECHEFSPTELVNLNLLKSAMAEHQGHDTTALLYLKSARQADRDSGTPRSQLHFTINIARSLDKSGEDDAAEHEWREFIDYAKANDLSEHQLMLAHKFLAEMLEKKGDATGAKLVRKTWFDEEVKKERSQTGKCFKLPESAETFDDGLVDFFNQARCNVMGFYEKNPVLIEQLRDVNAQFVVARRSVRTEIAELLDANGVQHLTDEQKLPYFFFMRCASAYLTAVELGAGGRTPEAYGAMRSCIENSLYAFHLFQKPQDATIWLTRPKFGMGEKDPAKKKARMAIGTAFSPGQILVDLEAVAANLAEQHRFYLELSIDEGAHPNVDVFKQHAGETTEDGGYTFSVSFLNPSFSPLCVTRILESTKTVIDTFKLIHSDWIW